MCGWRGRRHVRIPPLRIATCRDALVGMTAVVVVTHGWCERCGQEAGPSAALRDDKQKATSAGWEITNTDRSRALRSQLLIGDADVEEIGIATLGGGDGMQQENDRKLIWLC